MKFFILICLIVCARGLVVFEGYREPTCITPIWGSFPRLYFPVVDRPQGIDSQINIVFYGGTGPSIVGNFTDVNTSNVTFCPYVTGPCSTWNVVAKSNTSVCVQTPMFGYGRFYNVPSPGALELYRTSGDLTVYKPSTCTDYLSYGWVAYLETNIAATPTSPCASVAGTTQVFYDSDALSFFDPTLPAYTLPQPCGSVVPGSHCASLGRLYCVNNTDCSLDHVYHPANFPWTGTGATTVKMVSANRVDPLPVGGLATTTQVGGLVVVAILVAFLT